MKWWWMGEHIPIKLYWQNQEVALLCLMTGRRWLTSAILLCVKKAMLFKNAHGWWIMAEKPYHHVSFWYPGTIKHQKLNLLVNECKNILIVILCVWVFHLLKVYALHACNVHSAPRSQERVLDPQNWSHRWLGTTMWALRAYGVLSRPALL